MRVLKHLPLESCGSKLLALHYPLMTQFPTLLPPGRFLATLLAFCANTAVETPEVHIAYDASEGSTEREFMEVFLPDEGGHPREGRLARPNEFTEVFRKLDSSDETARITRAIQQYDEALRHWYFGGEWLSLSHLYMAVEALTEVAIERECADRGIDQRELARQNGIDPDDPERPRWKPALEAWCRAAVIFNSDTETYNAVKSASDGLEHGFMELSDVHRNAMIATDATFGYVRRSILWLLNISSEDFPDLVDRIPRDIQSFRKIIRGHFVGNGDDPAPPG
jgi:hypothetical protein